MIPNYQECMLPFLQLLGDNQIHTSKECVERLSIILNLTEEEKSELLPSGKQTTISNRTSWARFYLEKAGLVKVVSRGKYQITEQGQELLAEKPQIINNELLSRYEQFVEFTHKQSSAKGTSTENKSDFQPAYYEQTPEEVLDSTYKQLQSNLSEEILEKVLQQSPQFFEHLVLGTYCGYRRLCSGDGMYSVQRVE